MQNIIGLKDLRENVDRYIAQIEKGGSFLVVRKSKPVFKIVSPSVEEVWETVADFTELKNGGINACEFSNLLRKSLKNEQNRKVSK